jgi:peptidoglycan/LPS O-acetylase OafA/YrhL
METDSDLPEDPRTALDAVSSARRGVAERYTLPRWYAAGFAGLMGAFVLAATIDQAPWFMLVVLAELAAIIALSRLASRRMPVQRARLTPSIVAIPLVVVPAFLLSRGLHANMGNVVPAVLAVAVAALVYAALRLSVSESRTQMRGGW